MKQLNKIFLDHIIKHSSQWCCDNDSQSKSIHVNTNALSMMLSLHLYSKLNIYSMFMKSSKYFTFTGDWSPNKSFSKPKSVNTTTTKSANIYIFYNNYTHLRMISITNHYSISHIPPDKPNIKTRMANVYADLWTKGI